MNEKLTRKAGTPYEISQCYGIPEGTLANWRYKRLGPKYFRIGRKVLYFIEDVEIWIRQNPILTKDSIDE